VVQPAAHRTASLSLLSIVSWRTRTLPSMSGLPDALALRRAE
jgi:hypothetical protein